MIPIKQISTNDVSRVMHRLLALCLLIIGTGFLDGSASAADKKDCSHLQLWTDSAKVDSIFFFKFNPREWEMALLTSSQYNHPPLTAKGWHGKYNYQLIINAGMFAADNRTSLGYCRNFNHINNPRLVRYNAFLAFNPIDSLGMPARIIDRNCENFDSLQGQYQSVLQCMRMLSCRGESTWKKKEEKHSILALGENRRHEMIIFFAITPVYPPDFIELARTLDNELIRLIYLEGGNHASLYMRTGDDETILIGRDDSGFPAGGFGPEGAAIPNVIALRRR